MFNREPVVVAANPAACDMYGYTSEELIGLSAELLIHPDYSRHLKGLEEQITAHGEFLIESVNVRKDNTSFPVEVRGVRFSFEEKPHVMIIVRDITERKRDEEELKKRLMKFNLEEGNLYLVEESAPTVSFEAFKDLLNIGYQGVIISRTPEKAFTPTIEEKCTFFWLAKNSHKNALAPDLKKVTRKIEGIPHRTVVLIERLDYLVFENGFPKTLSFVHHLRELAHLKGFIAIFSIDPTTLKKEEFRLLEKECRDVELRYSIPLSDKLFTTLKVIYKLNLMGVRPSYGLIRKRQGISKPTVRTRITSLISGGYVVEKIKGRNKIVEMTEKGRGIFIE